MESTTSAKGSIMEESWEWKGKKGVWEIEKEYERSVMQGCVTEAGGRESDLEWEEKK